MNERAKSLRSLVEAGTQLSSAPSQEALLQRIVDLATGLAGARYGALGVLGPDGTVTHLFTHGLEPARRAAVGALPRLMGVLGVLLCQAETVRVADITRHPAFSGFPPGHPVGRSFLGVPIRAEGESLGNLYLLDKRDGEAFAQEDEWLLQAFAQQAALALLEARRHRELHESARRNQTLVGDLRQALDFLAQLLAKPERDQMLRHLVETVAMVAGTTMNSILLVDEGTHELVHGCAVGLPEAYVRAIGRVPIGGPRGGCSGTAVARGEVVIVEDMRQDPLWTPYLEQSEAAGLRAVWSVPLVGRGGRSLGSFAVYYPHPSRPTPELIERVRLYASQAALAIETARDLERLRQARRQTEALARASRKIGESLELSAVLDAIVTCAVEACEATSAEVILLDGKGGLTIPASTGFTAEQVRTLSARPEGLSRRVMDGGRPVLLPDLAAEPSGVVHPVLLEVGRRAAVAFPLAARDERFGAMWLHWDEARRFEDEEIERLGAFAQHAAIAIQNARHFEETERRRRAAESLADVGRLILQSLEPEEVAQRIADSLRSLFDAQSSILYRLEPQSGDLVQMAGSGDLGPTSGRKVVMPRGTGASGLAVRERRPVVTLDVLADPRIALIPEARARLEQADFRAVLAVPLVVKDRVIGALGVGGRAGRAFDDEAIRLVQTFADQTALALENARLYEAQEVRAARLRTLARLNQLVSSSLDTRAVLTGIARAAAELMDAPAVAFWIADESAQTLELRAFSDDRMGGDYPAKTVRYGQGGAGWVAAHRRPLNVPDVLADELALPRDWFKAHDLSSVLIVPIVLQDSLLGVLTLAGRKPFRLGPDDQGLLESFVAQAAVAIRNARLFEELRVAHAQLEHSQAQLVQAERLRALGEMAGGVAHDFNNLLAIILGNAEVLLSQVREPGLARRLEVVRQTALDGAQTVRRIQEFTRTRRTRPLGRVDVWELVGDVLNLTRPRWKDEPQSRGVQYTVRVEGGPVPPVAGRPEELREVFTNLLINALEAMPDGGQLVLHVGADAGGVRVSVRDSGCGMAEEARRRAFEPFFTTKGPRGTGLGLAVVWGILTRHGGTVEVESAPGAGTTFTLRLPLAQGIPAEEAPEPSPRPPSTARVLVIDDEPEVREVLRVVLEHQGYTVIEAGGGAEALARCEAEPIDLILTDLSMPEMSGWEMAATCGERFPRIPVGILTGWGDRLDPEKIRNHRVRFVLAKPFGAGDVLREVAKALEAGEGA